MMNKTMATDLRPRQNRRRPLSQRIKDKLHQWYLLRNRAMPRDWEPERKVK